ncbi:MAG TPA: carboxypeptidase regulatory-like domain-containing protein, partial [Longimicrobiales bacterium]
MIRVLRCFTLFALLLLFYTLPLSAQNQNGRIIGTVRDADGSAAQGAQVRATNNATGASKSAVTDAGGRFAISSLAPGSYTVVATLFGVRGVSSRATVQVGTSDVSVELVLQPVQVEALTVTAMLREQELADVPFSIAAPTAEVLRSRGADNLEGIGANVAGFNVQNLGPGQSQVAMRG